jgi:signal transduction histidine kinase
MRSLSRAFLLSAALITAFLLGALALQGWLRREATNAQAVAAAAFGERLRAAYALDPRSPAAWDEAYSRKLATLLEAEVRLAAAGAPVTAKPADVYASTPTRDAAWRIDATQSAPALLRQQLNQQRVLAVTVMLALVLGALPFLLALLGERRATSDTRAPWRAEAAGLERFARLTVERGDALAREQGARVRAEQDLSVSQSLLERSLEERVRLGRELHDNVSQTLYAVTLTLESVRKKMTAAPEIEQRLDQCMAELRRLNQETRAFLRELEPASVHRTPLALALAEVLDATGAARDVVIERRLEASALEAIPARHCADVVNILREALSNAVRHGRARHVSVRAASDGAQVALVVTDDGVGFATSTGESGHGLENMRARARALGGSLQIDSAPGKGTRVLLTLPVDSRSI